MRDIQRHGSEQSPEATPEAATEGPQGARRPAGGARDVQTSDRPSGGRTENRTHTEPKEKIVTDNQPTFWIDGDPLMEAIAATVYERCERADSGLVIDDPRNIAAAVAGVARRVLLREAADMAEALRQFEPATGPRKSAQVSENVGILRVVDALRDLASEAQQPSALPAPEGPEYARCTACGHIEPEHRPNEGPCLVCDCETYRPAPVSAAPSVPDPAETDEQRADRLETEQAHAAGDHSHCGITCAAEFTDELLRRARTQTATPPPTPADRAVVALAEVRQLCQLTIDASVRVQAIDQARDTLAIIDRHMVDEAQQGSATAMVCRECLAPVMWVDGANGGWWNHTVPAEDGHGIVPKPLLRAPSHRADEAQQPGEVGFHPRRGDHFEQWLKAQRDKYDRTDQREVSSEFWHEFDAALDLYRLHADTGTPLDEHVCEGQAVGGCECLEQQAGEGR